MTAKTTGIKNWLGSLLKSPDAESRTMKQGVDEDSPGMVGALNQLIWVTITLCLIAIQLGVARESRPVISMIILAGLIIDLFSYILMRRSKHRLARLLLVLATWMIFTVAAFAQGGLDSVMNLALIALVILAGLLLDARIAALVVVLNILAYTAMLLAEVNGLISEPVATNTPFTRWGGLVSILLLISALFFLAIRNLRLAAAHSQLNERELTATHPDSQVARMDVEKRLAERNQDLEQRIQQFQALAEITSTIATIRDLDALLERVPAMVSERLGFYHVGLFIRDEGGSGSEGHSASIDGLTLKAANSAGGKLLLEQSYRLTEENAGVAGCAALTLKPYIAQDVHQDKHYVALAELGETRLEAAFPLLAGGKLLGVLDLHDSRARSLENPEITILQILADQIAIAIENARLFKDSQAAIESVQQAVNQADISAWQQMLRSQPEAGYVCKSPGQATAATGPWSAEMIQAMNSGNIVEPRTHTARPTIALPIKIRDQVIGVVKLSKPREAGRWTADEIDLMETIGDQLSVALESARLYEETRRRAERERLTSEITARIRASNDPSAILQTAVRELRQALQADRAQIMLQVSHSSTGGRKSEEEPQVGKIAPPESADSQAAQEKTNE